MSRRGSFIGGLVAELLAGERNGKAFRLTDMQQDFKRLAALDYCRHARECFEAPALRELILLTRNEVWPHLNREQMRPRPTKFLAGLSSNLGVDLRAYPQPGPLGLGLRGFYVNAGHRPLKRPLIYVNTAHVQAAIVSTFCHEIGHHLGAEIFGTRRPASFFFYTGYEDHLRDPVELAADILVSLAAYPQNVARRIFGDPQKERLPATDQELTETILQRVIAHMRDHFGLNLCRISSTEQRLQYLAGLIHYAKLRWALLAEYRI
jgi:hypothetical protein